MGNKMQRFGKGESVGQQNFHLMDRSKGKKRLIDQGFTIPHEYIFKVVWTSLDWNHAQNFGH